MNPSPFQSKDVNVTEIIPIHLQPNAKVDACKKLFDELSPEEKIMFFSQIGRVIVTEKKEEPFELSPKACQHLFPKK